MLHSNNQCNSPLPSSGFTLIELLIVVTVVAVLSSMAVPAFRELRASIQVRTAASDLMSSLMLARSEALKRNATVDVKPSVDGWAGGWTVVTTDTTPVTLESKLALQDISVTASAVGDINFRLDGRNASAIQSLTFSSSAVPKVNAKCVYLAPSGRIAVKTDSDRNPANGCN